MAINFSEEDKQTIIELAPLYHYKIIANIIGKQPASVQVQARQMGIKLIQDKNQWTPEDDSRLIELAKTHHRTAIATEMKRSYSAISERCVLLKLYPPKKELVLLSDEEKDQIKLLAPFNTLTELATALNRPVGTISYYVKRNGISVLTGTLKSTEELVDKIRALAGTTTTSQIALELDLSYSNVFHICKVNEIIPVADKLFWAPEQKLRLKELAPTHTSQEIADEMGMTQMQVIDMANYLGVKTQIAHRNWTKDEIAFIKTCEGKHMVEVQTVIKKPKHQIRKKAEFFGVNIIREKVYWTPEEEEELRKIYGLHTHQEIAKRLNKSVNSIKSKARFLKLDDVSSKNNFTVQEIMKLLKVTERMIRIKWVKEGLKLVKYSGYQTVKAEDLTEFLKNNPSLWDARKLSYNFFGEQEWFLAKKAADEKQIPKNYYWTDEEDELIVKLFNDGMLPEEMADFVNKRVGGIRQRLKDKGLYYHPQFTDDEIAFIKANHKTMTSVEIANMLAGRSEVVVRKKMRDLDVYWENEEHKQLALALYKAGMPLVEIAKNVGRNIKTVGALLRENGFEINSFTSWESLEPLLIELHNQGKSAEEIFAELPTGDRTLKSVKIKLFRMRKKGIID